MKTKYYIKQVKKSTDEAAVSSLVLYSDNIEPHLRTDSSQILYWIDKYKKRFDDSLYVLNLYVNNELVGFTQLVHFTVEKVVVVDYIVLHPLHRRNNTFYEFIDQIKSFLKSKKVEFDYITAEIGSIFQDNQLTQNARHVIRLLKLAGFKVAKTNYYHPSLGSKIPETNFRSILMILTGNDIKFIQKETYLSIIEIIYFKHYLRWYTAFLKDKELSDYTRNINELFDRTKADLKKKKTVEVNGHNLVYSIESNPKSRKKMRSVFQWISMILLSLLLIFAFGSFHLFARDKLGIETDAQYYIVLITLFIIVIIVALFSENKSSRVARLLNKIFDLD